MSTLARHGDDVFVVIHEHPEGSWTWVRPPGKPADKGFIVDSFRLSFDSLETAYKGIRGYVYQQCDNYGCKWCFGGPGHGQPALVLTNPDDYDQVEILLVGLGTKMTVEIEEVQF